jgi:hypothetical protein
MYKFIGQMNCDYCKFYPSCKADEANCPYLAGWQDGQAKLEQWLHEPCEDHPALRGFGTTLLHKDCPHCQRETAPVSPKGGL